ncbi:succinylglutamate desuccinylase/aspartoacylase domain-containing protein [Allohahella marinimesophila]|uniref:Succinylglutamate desuccinylase/Aspartoacylase catalytic domain-containing protein n=1 Tax=Allohahella marinimesophila TaxID=1054972 RepID=A0ABP7NTD6_9GAMM
MQVRCFRSRPRKGALVVFPAMLLFAAPIAINSRLVLAESALAPVQTSSDAVLADANAGQVAPVAPNVQLRDVTSIDTVVDTANPSPGTGASTAGQSAETPAKAEPTVSEENSPAESPATARAEKAPSPKQTALDNDSSPDDKPGAAKTSEEATPEAPTTASTADSAVRPAKKQETASSGDVSPPEDEAPAQMDDAIAQSDDADAEAEETSPPATSKSADAVAKGFSAKLIGESEPEPDTSPESNTPAPSSKPQPLSAEVEAPARPKAVVGEPGSAAEKPEQEVAADLRLLGSVVKPGTAARLSWSPDVTISGLDQPTPVLVVHGAKPGPTLCLTSAVHGDELNGIEVVRGVMYDLDPEELSGTVVGVPIVNLQGFHRGSRYLVDRRDLNRFFPGYASGSMASRIAASLFNDIIMNCNMLVDLHTGSLRRANLPQLRADMRSEKVVEFTKGFDNMIVVHSPGSPGMMRNAAVERGIAAVTLEIGESLRIQRKEIKAGIHSINSLLEKQDMYKRLLIWGEPRPVFYNSTWLRTDRGGILESHIELGARVEKGDSLGVVIDPITNKGTDIISDIRGRVIGMAVDQVVMPGFATYHIGIESSERALGFQTVIQGRAKDAEPPTVEE